MPPSAVRAIVIDERGAEIDAVVDEGVWSSEAMTEERIVRFEGADGALIAQRLPPGPRREIQDAPEPCPACAASTRNCRSNAVAVV